MMALSAMGSFSDAHELREIPVIAANVQRLILPRQSQIWAVLHRADDPRRLVYSLAATFLGRMCLSGELTSLDEAQWALVSEAQRLYRQVWPLIKHGASYRYGPPLASYRYPQGWQAVLRLSHDRTQALAVVHTFGGPLPERVQVPLPAGAAWQVVARLAADGTGADVEDGNLACVPGGPFSGQVVHLRALG
jgi:alpha-galactosidase